MKRWLGKMLFDCKMSEPDTCAPESTPNAPTVKTHNKEQGPSAPKLANPKSLLMPVLINPVTLNCRGLR